jgi:hypothetical protein
MVAQNLDKLMKELKANSAVEHQLIDKQMLGLMNIQSDSASHNKIPKFLQRLEKMEVFTLDNYQEKKGEAIVNEINNYKDGNGYETLVAVNDKDDFVRIVAHKEGDRIADVNILVRDEKEIVVVRFIGNLNFEDLQAIVKEEKEKLQK